MIVVEDRGMLAASMTRFLTFSAAIGFFCVLAPAVVAAETTPAKPGNGARVDFERHIMGLFGRAGCNSGSCHGSFQGKGGFRLSLFGYDPEKDFYALTREAMGRRINPADPDASLLLLKATGQTEHGGGKLFEKSSWQYQLLREWIVAGAKWTNGSGAVAGLATVPPEYRFPKSREQGQVRVVARFADGSEEDVTAFCDFRSNDDAIAEITPRGQVTALRAGDTSIVASYRGNVRAVRVLVPREAQAGFRYPELPTVNYIDTEVFAKLHRLNILPSKVCSDTEFLRRVTIDTIGSLPTPDDVRAFVADVKPDKRARKIEDLLAHPLHAALWATKFSDITGNNTDQLENPPPMRVKRSQMWHDWFRKRIAENMPYDEIVHGVLCATSRDGLSPDEWLKQVKAIDDAAANGFSTLYADRPSLDLFWRRQQAVPVEQWGEKTAAAFLGVRLECAQCHKHPFDRWTQIDYRAFANIYAPVAFGLSPETKSIADAENKTRQEKATNKNQAPQVREVFIGAPAPGKGGNVGRPLPHPDTNRPLPAKALGGPNISVGKGEDPRVALFDWLRSPDNPFFAKSFVNRVWGHYLGVGIVDPVDNFSLANPPSNEKLLDALAQDFIGRRYDIRELERTILNSRVYQLSSTPNETNKLDKNNYSHCVPRPMMAEVVVDVLNDALGVAESFNTDAPANYRAIEVGASRLQNGNVGYAFRIFGRPPRTTACDCERAMEPALPQKLFLMADQSVVNKLQKCRVQQLVSSKKRDAEIFEELFLAALSRLPTEEEKKVVENFQAMKKDRQSKERIAFFTDVEWALINTREFILNH
jgi:hypothetical protein